MEKAEINAATDGISNDDVFKELLFVLVSAMVLSIFCTMIIFSTMDDLLRGKVSLYFYGGIFGVIFIVVALMAWSIRKSEWEGDWKLYSILANSKLAMLVSAAFTFVPIAVSVSNATGSQEVLPFTVYLYWASGLSFSIFLLVFKLKAPTVYKFSTFEDLMGKEGGAFVLQKDAVDVVKVIEAKEKVAQEYDSKGVLLADRKVMESFKGGNFHDVARVYYVMREYSVLLERPVRRTLFAFFILPAFVIPTLTGIKTLVVGVDAVKAVSNCGGLGRAIYHEILDLGKEPGDKSTCPKNGAMN